MTYHAAIDAIGATDMSLLTLPTETLQEIILELPIWDVRNLRMTCRKLMRLGQDEDFWIKRYRADHREIPWKKMFLKKTTRESSDFWRRMYLEAFGSPVIYLRQTYFKKVTAAEFIVKVQWYTSEISESNREGHREKDISLVKEMYDFFSHHRHILDLGQFARFKEAAAKKLEELIATVPELAGLVKYRSLFIKDQSSTPI